jgi:hypothetical protein
LAWGMFDKDKCTTCALRTGQVHMLEYPLNHYSTNTLIFSETRGGD